MENTFFNFILLHFSVYTFCSTYGKSFLQLILNDKKNEIIVS